MSDDPLRDRFQLVDADSNGRIEEPEFARLLDELGVGYTEPQVHAAFTSIDLDGTGQIDLEEFRAWWTSH